MILTLFDLSRNHSSFNLWDICIQRLGHVVGHQSFRFFSSSVSRCFVSNWGWSPSWTFRMFWYTITQCLCMMYVYSIITYIFYIYTHIYIYIYHFILRHRFILEDSERALSSACFFWWHHHLWRACLSHEIRKWDWFLLKTGVFQKIHG